MKRAAGVPDDATWETGLWGTREAAWEHCARDEDGHRHGPATYWRGDGTLLARSEYFHGVEHGLLERFHESGEPSQRGRIVDGERSGQHDSFRSISLTTERVVEGKHDGIWRCENDYEDGAVVRFTRYFDREGRRVDQGGQRQPELPSSVPPTAIFQRGSWIDGRIARGRWHGPFRRWNAAGILIEEGTFRRSRRSGPYTRWTRRGALVERGSYVGGRLKDQWIARPTGLPPSAVVEPAERAGGELHWVDGDAVRSRWNEEGQLIEQRQFEAGQPHGLTLEWNADGVLIVRSTYARGQLHGPCVRFYADGSVMSAGTYEAGKPIGTFVMIRHPDEQPAGFPPCNARIVRAELNQVSVRLFDSYGVECTVDGIPLELWRVRFPAHAAWREQVHGYAWLDAALPPAVLALIADDESLRRKARDVLLHRCAHERNPESPVALGFAVELLQMPGSRDRAALLELLYLCGVATDLGPATAVFVALLDDPDPAIRALVTPILSELAPKAVIGPLRAALARETVATVRASLHLALGALGEAVAAGLIANEPLERLAAGLGIVAARHAKAPPTATTALVGALAEPEPLNRQFHTIPWARTGLVAQVCEALRDAAGPKARPPIEPVMAALATATARSALVLIDALLTLAGDPLEPAVAAAIAGCEPAWERSAAIRELLRRRQLPVDRDALYELAKPKQRGGKRKPSRHD